MGYERVSDAHQFPGPKGARIEMTPLLRQRFSGSLPHGSGDRVRSAHDSNKGGSVGAGKPGFPRESSRQGASEGGAADRTVGTQRPKIGQ